LIAFPGRDVLHAKKLIHTLKEMHHKGMYKQLTFYLETCEAGSMFEKILPKPLPVYAVTAANARESSWGTFCGPQAKVAGKDIGSCLGDLFSVNWMMDSDNSTDPTETLVDQYKRVKDVTKQSHVMEYGQKHHIGSEPISDFQGDSGVAKVATPPYSELAHTTSVDSRNAKLDYLYHVYLRDGTAEAGDKLIKEIEARRAAESLDASLKASLHETSPDSGVEISWTEDLLSCHESATMKFQATCGWTEARLKLSKTLYSLCLQSNGDADSVAMVVQNACEPKVADIWA